MKLNKTNREEIISACIAHTFKRDNADLDAARTALADALYNHAFGDAEKIAKKLPKGWVQSTNGISIDCAGFTWRMGEEPHKPYRSLKLSRTRLSPHYINDAFKVTPSHPLYDQAQEVVDMHAKLHAAKQALRDKLTTLVHSVASTEKLREAWPEGAKFLPDEPAKGAALPVPVNLTREVNAMMGLKAA